MSTKSESQRGPHGWGDDYEDYLDTPDIVQEAEQRLGEAERDLADLREIADIIRWLGVPGDTPVSEVREQVRAERDRRRAARGD
jgi:hypothetical protein